jgi:hypoxanthine phosphoribosyltransferase
VTANGVTSEATSAGEATFVEKDDGKRVLIVDEVWDTGTTIDAWVVYPCKYGR